MKGNRSLATEGGYDRISEAFLFFLGSMSILVPADRLRHKRQRIARCLCFNPTPETKT
ncbi:hypothetical protein Pla52o_43290 [Novipirellula galeiformis]|uniref:Uncharacterized protein n=1 Tax=Novipirellula galeiformis TaxID=2528004 RepID=A0A5C6CAF5_9BACT|nr:hypothetical protein Pla52o_43290 [Novipirellula galeiformis]